MEKKMKKMKYIGLIVVFAALLFQGCSEDFITRTPMAAESEVTFYTDYKNLETAVIACYSQLSAMENLDLAYTICMESAGDDIEAGGKYFNELPDFTNNDLMLHDANNPRIRKFWGYNYKGVYFCNMFLKYFPSLLESGNLAQGETETLKTRIAEVKFLRAMYNFLLTQGFGGIVLLEEPMAPADFPNATRSTVKEVYQFIERDLQEAIPDLPLRSGLDDIGRASKGSAQALMAKMLLYESSYAKYKAGDDRFGAVQQRWDEALSYAETVINSGEYSLVGLNGETFNTYWGPTTNAYRYIFTVDGDNQPGNIFSSTEVFNSNYTYIQSRGQALTVWTTVRYTTETTSELGWSFMCPTQDFVALYDSLDPRRYTTVFFPWDTVNRQGGWEHADISTTSTTGYHLRKYECSAEQYWNTASGNWNGGPMDIKLIRLADVYLFAAEAAYEDGQPGVALNFLNTVRLRADMCDGIEDGIPAPIDMANFDLEDIRTERRLELTGESSRFFDIVRWGVAESLLDGRTANFGAVTIHYQSPKNDFWPIPQNDIDAVGGTLQQYQGW